jgi:hypothetical protein
MRYRLCLCAPLMLTALFAIGCAHYAFDLVSPPELQRSIDAKAATEVQVGPLAYVLQQAEDRLVITVRNDTDGAVKLVGSDSYVVDPRGESHPLPTRTIAPHAVTKLIFPPLNPSLQRGPVFGFGVGVGYSNAGGSGVGVGAGTGAYDDFGATPRYYSADVGDPAAYWSWDGPGTIRMRLAYESADGQRFSHEFEFVRRKT